MQTGARQLTVECLVVSSTISWEPHGKSSKARGFLNRLKASGPPPFNPSPALLVITSFQQFLSQTCSFAPSKSSS